VSTINSRYDVVKDAYRSVENYKSLNFAYSEFVLNYQEEV